MYQPAGTEERAAISFRQSENSTIEENAKEVLLLVDQYYNTITNLELAIATRQLQKNLVV